MHRSALSVLVVLAAVAACSAHDDSEAIQLLSKDPALSARLETAQDDRQLPLPDECGIVKVAKQSSAAIKSQAEELTQQASRSEILGNVMEARQLLRRATALDATNTSAAYHLGRTSEELGDNAAATVAYCRYLALSPSTAESGETRERVIKLAHSVTSVAAGNVSDSVDAVGKVRRTSTTRHSRFTPLAHRSSATPGASAAKARPVVPASSARRAHSVGSAQGSTNGSLPPSGPAIAAPAGDGAPEQSGDVSARGANDVSIGRPMPREDQSSAASLPASRGPSRAQSAGIGAATGAILGAVTGRSMKSAVIGAAAGGILGTMTRRGRSPIGTGTFH